MNAIVIDLKDFGLRTPEQVVRVFYRLYSPGSVKQQLWEVFSLCAVNNQEEPLKLNMDTPDIAVLFDQLIALVNAVEELYQDGDNKCPVCGRDPEPTGN